MVMVIIHTIGNVWIVENNLCKGCEVMEEFAKVDEYEPTQAELKLIEVLSNPLFAKESIVDKCKLAEISPTTYYKAMKKEGFRNLLKKTALELVIGNLGNIINATIKFATLMPQCSADRKILLQMADMVTEKTESSVEVKLPNIIIK
jgi:hypothetical protein